MNQQNLHLIGVMTKYVDEDGGLPRSFVSLSSVRVSGTSNALADPGSSVPASGGCAPSAVAAHDESVDTVRWSMVNLDTSEEKEDSN